MSFQNFVIQHKNQSYTTNHQYPKGGTIVCEEEKSKYVYKYNCGEKFLKLQIDGGLISDQNIQKCDYLLLNYTEKDGNAYYHSIFIELKGSNVIHACEQISETIKRLGVQLKGSELHARIVPSKMSVPNAQMNVQKAKFRKDYRCILYCQCRRMEEESDQDGYPSHYRDKGN
jgi:hypothetical protein